MPPVTLGLLDSEDRICRETDFRLVADCLPVLIWTANPEFAFTYFNRAWLKFRGCQMEDEIGSGWTRGLHLEGRDSAIETYLKAFTGRRPFRMRCRLRRADGAFCWIENTGMPQFALKSSGSAIAGCRVTPASVRLHGTNRCASLFTRQIVGE